jgi:deazaflavin-dependent oxidoreductase (nitroreductase family)
VRYGEANGLRRFLRRAAVTAPGSWFAARAMHHLDRATFGATRGRHTFASLLTGLPVVMLTTTGARTGRQRTLPVLGLPDGDSLVVIASNYGQDHHPAWYHNLRAYPVATVTVGGATYHVHAYEATGAERERLWRRGLEVYPGWSAYQRRARNRRIPVVVLALPSDEPA